MRPARILTGCIVAAALAVALGAASAPAQDLTLDVDIASLDQDDVGALHAVVNVLDVAGRPIPGLTTENVQATLQGKPAPVLDVQAAVNASFGIDVVLVVDISGSMEGTPLEQAKTAAKRFVDGLGPRDRVAMLTFGDTVTTVQEFTANAEKMVAVLEGLEATGNTALYQAVADSARMAVASASARKAIIFLSDGLDNGGKSRIAREDSLSAAATLGVPTFVIGLGDETDRSYLSELAEVTGGRFLETPSPQGLAQLYEDIANFLRAQYVVSIDATGVDLQQPTSVHLEVSVNEATGSAERTLKPPRLPAGPPTVTISSGLLPGQEVSDRTTVVTEVVSEDPLSALIFRVDDINVYQLEEPPFQYELDPEVFAEGTHTLRVEAVTTFGEVGTAEVDFIAVAATVAAPLDRLSPEPFILAGLVMISGGLAVLYIMSRHRRRRPAEAQVQIRTLAGLRRSPKPPTVDWEKSETPLAEIVQEPMGQIVVTSGPLAGRQFPVGASPVSIGSGHRCAVALSDEEGSIAPEEARVWVRNGRLMLHRLSHLSNNASAEQQGAGWSILDPGDRFQIGGCQFRFEPASEADDAEQRTPSPDGSATSVLRDDSALARGQEPPTER